MSVWDTYKTRIEARGDTKRKTVFRRELHFLESNLRDSLSYHQVNIDGVPQEVAIINSDNLNEKKMLSFPGDDIRCGSLVEWEENYWLVVEKDANNEVYTRTKLLQCNHLLKWVDDEDIIREQWCVIEDGTKYLTGEYEDRNFIVTRGDSRISMTIAKNEHTVKFGRENRFLIDDPDANDKLAYLLTKPLKVGKSYQGSGIYSFVLQEVVSTDDDNMELGIADYYKHFPKDDSSTGNDGTGSSDDSKTDTSGKKVWL